MVARGGLDSGDFGEDGVGEWLLLSRFLHL
jgi:hypothetical protein